MTKGLADVQATLMRSEIRRRATLGFAAVDESFQFLADCGIHRRGGLEFGDDFLELAMRAFGRPGAAIGLPGFIVGPVRQERLVEGGGIAVLRVLRAKEMTVIAHFADRIQGDVFGRGGQVTGSI